MPATTLTPVTTAATGTVLGAAVAVDAPNGNKFLNPRGTAVLTVINGAGAPITVTITTTKTIILKGITTYTVADQAVTVTNATTKIIGPFDKDMYNDASGYVTVNWSSGTTITAQVIQPGLA
jgi:hypothetical protein